MTDKPKFLNAPGCIVRPLGGGWEARWQCRTDLAAKGFEPKSARLWTGTEPTEIERTYVSDECERMQAEMLVFGRGGIPTGPEFDGTLRSLINAYQTDPDSTYHGLRYQIRRNYDALLIRIAKKHGHEDIADIKARVLLAWHKEWTSDGEHIAMGRAFIGMLRTLTSFGATMIEDEQCIRLRGVLAGMRFKMPKPRQERITAEQVMMIRAKCHEWGWYSIALAQAAQFELTLRQKDIIGEWVPVKEPGVTDITSKGKKWLHGLRWSEIDAALTIRHVTSKTGKEIEVNLYNAPMLIEELTFYRKRHGSLPSSGAIIVSEITGLPWVTSQFRKKWREAAKACGIPNTVWNMDTRAGAITEATEAGAPIEHVKHAATHSDIGMTQRYSRGATEKVAGVMQLRAQSRNKPRTE